MGYKIVAEPCAWWPVAWQGVSEDGTLVENKIEMRFRLLKVDAAAAFLREMAEGQAAEASGSAELSQMYAEFVAQIATDWRGVEAENGEALRWDVPKGWLTELDEAGKRKPLVAPNLKLLMGEGGLYTHIFNAFREVLSAQPKIRAGN